MLRKDGEIRSKPSARGLSSDALDLETDNNSDSGVVNLTTTDGDANFITTEDSIFTSGETIRPSSRRDSKKKKLDEGAFNSKDSPTLPGLKEAVLSDTANYSEEVERGRQIARHILIRTNGEPIYTKCNLCEKDLRVGELVYWRHPLRLNIAQNGMARPCEVYYKDAWWRHWVCLSRC